jgi:hypothetical protein
MKMMKLFEGYKERDITFTSEEFMKLIADAQETLSYRMKTQEERKMLEFLNDI